MVHRWIMEPGADPFPSMDSHDSTSIQRLSGSSSPLSNSLMGTLSPDGGLERDDGDGNLSKSGVCVNSQRKQRSSAFPSSLTWDSDSERETFDEEELQQYSNPHGLAAESPGSPTCVQEQDSLDCGVYQTPEKPKNLLLDNDLACPLEGQDQGRDDTYIEPGMAQSSTQQSEPGPLLSDTKPKEGHQNGKDEEKGAEGPSKKEIKRALERDVYTFPGDSDPESPPPGPWAHCTFIQRRRKKRALLRPFSGISPWQRTLGIARKTRVTSTRVKECSKSMNDEGGVFEFKEEEEEKVPDGERRQRAGEKPSQKIFTCVECSVYFKNRAHLREHMRDHDQDGGKSGQQGEDGSGRRRAKKTGFECMECGQNFADRLVLVDHHRLHQESRRKILEKLERGGKNASENESCRNCNDPDAKDSSTACGQFVCLKCSYSSDVPEELADHAKTHATRARAKTGVHRTLTRRQQKSRKKGQARPSGKIVSIAACSERYPTRASVQTVDPKPEDDHLEPAVGDAQDDNTADPLPEPIQNHIVPANPVEPTDHQELASVKSDDTPLASPSLQESGCTEVSHADNNIPNSQSPEPLVSDEKTSRKGKDVVCKSSGIRRSSRVVRSKMLRTRASGKLDSEPDDTSDTKSQIENTEDTTEQCQTATEPTEPQAEPEADTVQARPTEVESPAVDTVLSSSPPPKIRDESHEEIAPDNAVDGCSKNDTDPIDEDQEDDEDDDSDEEDVVKCLLNVLNEEEDEEDEEGMPFRTAGKKCPYCQDCFDNGIGLANHIRGHLNRVGVSYKVRHFISPEEVNAIEKKFSYQKKKKKVANFDPSTFSVMRCEFCSAGFDTRAGLSSHARAHLRDFGITNWEVTASPINVLRELFSKRPDLALSLTTAYSSESQEPELGKEEEEEEESGTSEPLLHEPESATPPWKEERSDSEAEGGNKKREEEAEKVSPLDHLTSSPESNSSFPLQPGPADTEETELKGSSSLKCEVCNAVFETRRGLSSHARSHLRQLGVVVSESSGAPIDLLYQIAKERDVDACLSSSPLSHPPTPTPRNTLHSSPNPTPTPRIGAEFEDEPEDIKPPLPLSVMESVTKASTSPSCPSPSGSHPSSPYGRSPSPSLSRSRSPSPVLRKAPISSLLPVSSLLRSHEHKSLARTHNVGMSTAKSRPLWAPQENDAPLNLTVNMDPNEDIICKLCGAWFETRKGLSSHARAHLRHFGVEYSESKGSPIDLLDTLILTDDFKHRAIVLSDGPEDLRIHAKNMASHSPPTSTSTSSAPKKAFSSNSLLYKTAPLRSSVGAKATSSSSSSSAHSLLSPPAKKLKPSTQHVFRMSGMELMSIPLVEPMKDVGCEFCGEVFENRKGLSSHARSHLRQLGITEWSVNGSPIDTLRDVIARRGLPCVMPLKPLKSPSSSPSPGAPRTSLNYSSSSNGVSGRLPFSQHQSAVHKMSVSAPTTSTSPTVLMVKPKEEPEQMEITLTGPGIEGHDGYSSESLHPNWMSSDNLHPVNLVMTQEREPSRDIRCDFCGEFFENRKGLSSHARSHLRHMGITEWSVNGSPIDTLWEIMRNQGVAPAAIVPGVKEEPGHNDMQPWKGQVYQSSKVSPKSPLSLLHSGSRLHKHGLGPSTTPPARKLYNMAPIGKRVLGTKKHLGERPMAAKSKTFSPPPQDFTFKGRMSTDKHGVGHMDASCELCGFAFENRKALASHARAHLRQFGVTEWSVNGSPIETLSAWMRSRPETVAELHRSYLAGGHTVPKKKNSSSLSSVSESKSMPTQKHSASQWASPTLSQGRNAERESMNRSWSSPSRPVEVKNGSSISVRHGISTQGRVQHSNCALPHAQVARSELNVRVPRGIERRPLKHPSHADGGERESCPPKTPRTSTVPALVPKPSSTPLVKLVGKIYSLKCRFCDVEFHGPLSVQEDWIRHLQQHILKLDYNKPAPTATNTPAKPDTAAPATQASATTSASTTTTTTATTAPPASATAPNPTPSPSVSTPIALPTSTLTSLAPLVAKPGAPTTAEQQVLTPAT